MKVELPGPDAPIVRSPKLGPMVPLLSNSPRQWIAESGMMLRVLVGSGVHGTAIEGQDDRDEMAVCVEPSWTVIGHRRFEHYGFRTQPEGVCSGPGDLDLIVYGLRKYAFLAAGGNPTALLPLFVPEEHVCWQNDFGRELRQRRNMFLSRKAGERFKGYLHSQREGLMGLRSGGTRNQGRADIREKYGFDTKFAMHMVRLGLQGLELMRTGQFTLPIPEPDLTWLRELRQGEHTKEEALERAEQLHGEIGRAVATSPLPEEPNWPEIDAWMESVHRRYWGWA